MFVGHMQLVCLPAICHITYCCVLLALKTPPAFAEQRKLLEMAKVSRLEFHNSMKYFYSFSLHMHSS